MSDRARVAAALRWLPWLAVLAGACAVHAWRQYGVAGDLSYFGATASAAVVAVTWAKRHPPGQRLAWASIAAGVTLSAIGDCIWVFLDLFGAESPDASVADVFWLAAYVALAVGLSSMFVLSKPSNGSGSRLDVDGLIDMGSFAVVAIIVVSQVVDVADIFADTSLSLTVQVVWATYPVLDAALLTVLLRAIVGRRIRGAPGAFLSFGIACWLVSDFAYLLVADVTDFSTWLDIGWMVGAAGMAVATAFVRPLADTAEVDQPTPVGSRRVLINIGPLILPATIELWAYAYGDNPNPIPLFLATAALIVLAYLRSTRLVRARDLHAMALERRERYYQALAENSSDSVLVLERDGRTVRHARNLGQVLGLPVAQIRNDLLDLILPIDHDLVRSAFSQLRTLPGRTLELELRARHADGSHRWLAVRSVNLIDDPAVEGLVISIHDITDRKRAEEELTHRAFHDELTGLANRALFNDRVDHALERSSRGGSDVAVVYLDIDGFKTVNDSRGHESGDHVLREIAARLRAAVGSADTVARLGGDEFAILFVSDQCPLDDSRAAARRILQSLRTPMQVEDQQVVLSASIGITGGDSHSTASSMLRDADIAMYRAKTTGKGKWTLYHPEMRTAAVERMELESDLIRALGARQLSLVYQPIIELETERVVGFEALLRWNHPTRGMVSPDTFIPIAEDNGSIVPIGRWVLEEACRAAANFQRAYPGSGLTMAVNLSVRQIATPAIVDHVAHALRIAGLSPSSLVLELTESVLIEDAAVAAERLRQLRALDVRLAIDDFGTGYSSLSYLRQFPIDILKIDRSFISSITDRDQMPAIVRGLLDLGKTLQLETVAEGIELDVQRDTLRAQHCEFGQGFLFARPLPAAEAMAWLTQLNNGHVAMAPAQS